MDLIQKVQRIIQIQNDSSEEKIAAFNSPIAEEHIQKMERLLEEPLPEAFKTLYYFADGQEEKGKGVLFYESLMPSEKIIGQLEFSRNLIKPTNPEILDKERSDQFLKKITDFFVGKVPKTNFLGWKKSWYKLEFSCGLNFFSGPYLYASEKTTESQRKNLDLDSTEVFRDIGEAITGLHHLEKGSYNWDQLDVVVFSDGGVKVNRVFFDFGENSFTSTPTEAIKKKYFHYKWLPLFSDHGGNYIGIDLDPDIHGKKGQIIIYGRDEYHMTVVADDLEGFFDLLLHEMTLPDSRLMHTTRHLHDVLRAMKA